MKWFTMISTALLMLPSKSKASRNLKGAASTNRIQNNFIDVTFNGLRVHKMPDWDEGHSEEWDLEFELEAFQFDLMSMDLNSFSQDSDSFTKIVPKNVAEEDLMAIDGETKLTFNIGDWDTGYEIRVFRVLVKGTELDNSVDEITTDDSLPSCAQAFLYWGWNTPNDFTSSMRCENEDYEFTVYFKATLE